MVWPWLTNSNYFSHSLTWYIHIGLKRETCQGPRCPCEKPEPHRDSCRCQLHQELHSQGYFLWHPLDWHLLNISLVNWSPVCSPGTWNFLELSRLVTKWECCVLQIFPMLTTVVSWVQNSLLQLRDTIISTQLYAYEHTVLSTSSSCEELRRIQSQSCQKMISSPVHICGRVFLEDDICFDCDC